MKKNLVLTIKNFYHFHFERRKAMCKTSVLFALMVMLMLAVATKADVVLTLGSTSSEANSAGDSFVINIDTTTMTFHTGGGESAGFDSHIAVGGTVTTGDAFTLTGNAGFGFTSASPAWDTADAGSNNVLRFRVNSGVANGLAPRGDGGERFQVNEILWFEVSSLGGTTLQLKAYTLFNNNPSRLKFYTEQSGGGIVDQGVAAASKVFGAPIVLNNGDRFGWGWTDGGGGSRTGLFSITFDVVGGGVNVPPDANAGEDVTVNISDLPLQLNGSASDVDGPEDVSVLWTVVSGPGNVTFDPVDANTVDPLVAFDALGTYELQLEATDGADTSTDTVVIEVVANDPPVVTIDTASPVTMYYDEILAVAATVADDGKPAPPGVVTLLWTVTSGDETKVIFDGATDEDTNVSFTDAAAAGSYTLTLTADDSALEGSASIDVTILDNVAPTVDAGEDQVVALSEGGTAALAGSASDDGYPKPAALTVTWEVISGDPGNVSFSPSANVVDAVATFAAVGSYELQLTADDGAVAASDTMKVLVTPVPVESFSFGPEDDTHVKYNRNETHGADTTMIVRTSNWKSFLKFDVYGNVPGVIYGATLRLKASRGDATAGPVVYAIEYGPSGEWFEETLNNKPDDVAGGEDLVEVAELDRLSPLGVVSGNWYKWDVTAMVLEADGKANFKVAGGADPEGASPRTDWYTKESSDDNAPQLVVLYDPNQPYNPLPMDEAEEVHPGTSLSWFPGAINSATNTVYLSTDPEPFANPEKTWIVAKGAADPNRITLDLSADFPNGLDIATTYYWSVNNGERDSAIWSLTTMAQSPFSPQNIAPADTSEELIVPGDMVFEYRPGDLATSHDLYIGTDPAAVENLTSGVISDIPTVYAYDPNTDPVRVSLDTTHYWRMRGTNDSGGDWASAVWSFTTTNYEVVADFDYDDPNSSDMFAGGKQDMNVADDGGAMRINYASGTTRVSHDFGVPQDWSMTTNRAALYLRYKGWDTNAAATLSVELSDGAAADSVAIADVLVNDTWANFETWDIDLSQFAVDLSNIVRIAVEVESTGSGKAYIDNIRVYAPRCVSDFVPGDFVDSLEGEGSDCGANVDELLMLAQAWAGGPEIVNAVDPGTDMQLIHFAFDDTNLTQTSLVSYNGVDFATATVTGATLGVPGESGVAGDLAMDCGGSGQASLDNPTVVLADVGATNDAITIALWAKGDIEVVPETGKIVNKNAWIGKFGGDATNRMRIPNGAGRVVFGGGGLGGEFMFWDGTTTADFTGEWVHYACVLDNSADFQGIYRNGELVVRNSGPLAPFVDTVEETLTIGSWHGVVDDFVVYNRALSQAEVVYLAKGAGGSVVQNPVSAADTNGDGEINFEDFADIAAVWLDFVVWP